MDRLDYEKMKQVDVRTVDVNTLVDIDEIQIAKDFSKEKRMADFIEKIKNPFCFKCNGIAVRAVYNEDGENLEEKLVNLFMIMSGISSV